MIIFEWKHRALVSEAQGSYLLCELLRLFGENICRGLQAWGWGCGTGP